MTQESSPAPSPDLHHKLEQLSHCLRSLGSVLVCYSGGVDSAFLLAVAHRELQNRAIGLTAISPSLPQAELDEAKSFARTLGVTHLLVPSLEMDNQQYVANKPDRCFHCKSELYRIARQKCDELGILAAVNGTNSDDQGDYRPGLSAAQAMNVRSPLAECGFGKADVRQGAKLLGLPFWNKPATACLASRIPYGTSVTPSRLTQVGEFEGELRQLGFSQLRVRYHDRLARIELEIAELARALEPPIREQIVTAGRRHGFLYVTLDLSGYRMGSHNEVLREGGRLPILE